MVHVTYLISGVYGIPLEFRELLPALQNKGIHLSLILLDDADSQKAEGSSINSFVQWAKDQSIPVRYFPAPPQSRLLVRTGKLLPVVLRALREFRPEVVHTHLVLATLTGLMAARILDIPSVYTRHFAVDHYREHPHAHLIDRVVNHLAGRVVAVSPAIARILQEVEGVDPARIHVIPHGLPDHFFRGPSPEQVETFRHRWRLQGRFPVVGLSARFVEWKGVEYALNAFREIRNIYPRSVLAIIDTGWTYPYARWIRRKIQQEFPEDSIRRIPFVEDIRVFLRSLDLLIHVPVHPYAESFGQIYLEAMAMKVPLVCTRSGIALDILEHGKSAWVVPFRDVRAIVQGICHLVEHPELRASLTEHAYRIAQSFRMDRKVEAHLRLYQDIVRPKRGMFSGGSRSGSKG